MDHRAVVTTLLTDLFGVEPGEMDGATTLDALGLDSLDRAELALALEQQVGGRIDDEDLLPVETVDDLSALARRTAAAMPGTGPAP